MEKKSKGVGRKGQNHKIQSEMAQLIYRRDLDLWIPKTYVFSFFAKTTLSSLNHISSNNDTVAPTTVTELAKYWVSQEVRMVFSVK